MGAYHDAASSSGSAPDPESDPLPASSPLTSTLPLPVVPSTHVSPHLSGLRPSLELYTKLAPVSPTPSQFASRQNNKENLVPFFAASSVIPPAHAPLDARDRPLFGGEARRHSGNLPSTSNSRYALKQPLGSHAPLARTPSLDHTFMFPPSPQKKAKSVNDVDSVERVSCFGSLKHTLGRGLTPNEHIEMPFSLTTSEKGRARVWVDELNKRDRSHDVIDIAGPFDHDRLEPVSTTVSASTRDADVWTHMESDPPSALSPNASPAPLTRKMMLALAQAHHMPTLSQIASKIKGSGRGRSLGRGSKGDTSDASCTSLTMISKISQDGRKAVRRSLSLGGCGRGASKDIYGYSRNEGSRAGGEETCAEMALGRKRARILDEEELSVKGKSNGGKKSARSSRRESIASNCSKLSLKITPATKKARTSLISPTFSTDSHNSVETDCGDLSFSSSVTTASNVTSVSSTSEHRKLGYAHLANVAQSEKVPFGSADERECAQLLLGLGGLF